MMKMNGIYKYLICFFFFFCTLTIKVNATSANFYFNSNNSIYNGNEITVTLAVSGISGGRICGISGNLNFDSSYLQYVQGYGMSSPFSVQLVPSNNYKYAGVDMSLAGFTNNVTVLTFKFKALKLGNTTVSLSNASFNDCNNVKVNVSASKSISITTPPSSNSNLASLSVAGHNLNFNPNTTNYNVNVDSNVSNISINGSAADGGAKVSGIGNKSLNFGNNVFKVVVTAPSGATKTYTINVNRKDNRSSNTNLSNLLVQAGTLEPNFSKNVTTYSLKVPYEVSDLSINAITEDNKAKVSIAGNTGLISEETRDVIIKVIAENGQEKIYLIKVTRGKDSSKPLSTNNYLNSLTTNIGILSPIFDKEKLNYIVYLPFEVDSIILTATKEDNKYATLKTNGPTILEVGNNDYTFEVVAEDGTSRIYKIVVVRNRSIDSSQSSSLLNEIILTNGKLNKSFDKNNFEYTFTKGKDFKIEVIAEDNNSKVTVVEKESIITIIVEAPDGNIDIYILKLRSSIILPIIGLISSIGLISLGTFLGYHFGKKKKFNKN